jgi:hypothetical protein
MAPRERALALEIISAAWEHLTPSSNVLAAVRAQASALPKRYPDVSPEFAEHIAAAAVWYLDRATRRIGDPDRDGLTPGQQAVNLSIFTSAADGNDIERLFALAAALNSDDV